MPLCHLLRLQPQRQKKPKANTLVLYRVTPPLSPSSFSSTHPSHCSINCFQAALWNFPRSCSNYHSQQPNKKDCGEWNPWHIHFCWTTFCYPPTLAKLSCKLELTWGSVYRKCLQEVSAGSVSSTVLFSSNVQQLTDGEERDQLGRQEERKSDEPIIVCDT